MGAIHLILGRTWQERESWVDHFPIQIDALGRERVLRLRPTHRAVTHAGRRSGQRRQFSPTDAVLNDYLAQIAGRLHPDKTVLSPDGLVFRLAGYSKDPRIPLELREHYTEHQLGALFASVFELHEEALSDKVLLPTWLHEIFSEYRKTCLYVEDFAPLSALIRHAADTANIADPRTQDLVFGQPNIWLDDVTGLSRARTKLLLRLIQTWSEDNCNVFLSIPAPRVIEHAELLDFFTQEESHPSAPLYRGHDAGRRFRKQFFEQFCDRSDVGFFWADTTGLTQLEPETPSDANIRPPIATDLVYGAPAPGPSIFEQEGLFTQATLRINVHNPPTLMCEVDDIAAEIKRGIECDGWSPHEIALVVPDLPTYAPTILQSFSDHGIPIDFSSGKHLLRSPLGSMLAALLRLSSPQSQPDDLFDVLSVAPHIPGIQGSVPKLIQAAKKSGAQNTHPRSWMLPIEHWLAENRNTTEPHLLLDAEACSRFYESSILPLLRADDSHAFLEALHQAIEDVGYPNYLLNSTTEDTELSSAWNCLQDLLEAASRELQQIGSKEVPNDWVRTALLQRLSRASYRLESPNPNRVAILGALETRGLSLTKVWVAGLVQGAFPRPLARHPLADPSAWAAIQHVQPLAECRSILHGLMRECLLHDGHSLALSWPMRIHGKEQQPASPLSDTLNAFPKLLRPYQEVGHAKAAAPKSHHHRDGDPLGNKTLEALFEQQRRRQRLIDAPGVSVFEGDTGLSAVDTSTSLPITRIEAYVKCPARDWYRNVLQLRDDDELQEDPNARSTGSLLHKILETFIQESIEDYRKAPPPHALLTDRLYDIAVKLIGSDAYQPSMSEDGRDQLRRRWLPGLKDEAPKGILAVWLEREFSNLPERFPMSVEVDIVGYAIRGRPIRGRIDRIDGIGSNGALIVDYKSGKAPGKSTIEKGLALQGVLYAEALRPMLPDRDSFAALYSQLNAASEVKEDGWSGDPQLFQPSVSAKRVAAGNEQSRRSLLEHAEHAVGALSAGLHHNSIAATKDAGCDYCSFHRICRHTDETVDAIRKDERRCGPLEEKQ